MTELLTRPVELEVESWPARGIAFRDKVRLHFLYRFIGETSWMSCDYSIDADIVSVQHGQDETEGFQPWFIPRVAVPEGEQYATTQPRRVNEAPFLQQLPDGTPIEMRYVVVQLDDQELK